MVAGSRNPELAHGIGKYGRSKMFKRSGRWKFVKKGGPKKAAKAEEPKVPANASRYYEADDVKVPYPSRKNFKKPAALRSSITPGTVLILLAGRFRGKRVVFLKRMEKSGLLLVSGPYKINGVPLRRVNQSYVIATSTKLDISKVKVPEHIDDAYFARVNTNPPKDDAGMIKPETKIDAQWLEKRKADQKTIDSELMKAVKAVGDMDKYLNAKFSLTKGQAPHEMKF